MTILNAQRAATEALRHIDNQLVTELDDAGRLRDQANRFRNMLFEALAWVEEQSFQLKVLQVKTKREEANLMRVELRERLPIVLFLDPEPAVDLASGEQGLVSRMYAVLAPPVPGLLRQYTILPTGGWRRSTFSRDKSGQLGAKTVAAAGFSAEMLLLEAVDLIGYLATLRFGWPDHGSHAAVLGLDELRDRARNRDAAIGSGSA